MLESGDTNWHMVSTKHPVQDVSILYLKSDYFLSIYFIKTVQLKMTYLFVSKGVHINSVLSINLLVYEDFYFIFCLFSSNTLLAFPAQGLPSRFTSLFCNLYLFGLCHVWSTPRWDEKFWKIFSVICNFILVKKSQKNKTN